MAVLGLWPWGRVCAVAMYRLIVTGKLNDVDPQALLADVLARIVERPHTRVHQLLLWNSKAVRHQTWAALVGSHLTLLFRTRQTRGIGPHVPRHSPDGYGRLTPGWPRSYRGPVRVRCRRSAVQSRGARIGSRRNTRRFQDSVVGAIHAPAGWLFARTLHTEARSSFGARLLRPAA